MRSPSTVSARLALPRSLRYLGIGFALSDIAVTNWTWRDARLLQTELFWNKAETEKHG
jgi:hypothetical protein